MNIRKLFALSVFAPSAAVVAAPALGYQGGGYYAHGTMWGGGWSGNLFGWLMMLFLFVAVIVLVVAAVRWMTGTGHRQAPSGPVKGNTPLDILKERFARGEIDKQEFEEKKRLLSD